MEAENTHPDVSKTDGQEQLDLNVLSIRSNPTNSPHPKKKGVLVKLFMKNKHCD